MPPAPARSALIALLVAACGSGEPAAPAPPPPTEPSCPAAAVDVPSEPGYPTAESLEEAAVALVRRDVAPSACLVRVSAQQGSVLVVASHEGATFRMRLDARLGVARESAAPHVAAQRLLEGLVEAGVEQALSTGHTAALGLADHGAACFRDVGTGAGTTHCVRTDAALMIDAVIERPDRRVVVRAATAAAPATGVEWEVAFSTASPAIASITSASGPLVPGGALGDPPPPVDRFARLRASGAAPTTLPHDEAAARVISGLPRGTAAIRLETRTVGALRVVLLSACEGLLAHCVNVVALRDGANVRAGPSFSGEPARIDLAEDAAALAPGAIRVRVIESGSHDGTASEIFLVPSGADVVLHRVSLGSETARGDEETVTEGCYRALTIDGPGRVRLSGAQGWSGTHGRSGWQITTNRECALDEVLCLDAARGFGACR